MRLLIASENADIRAGIIGMLEQEAEKVEWLEAQEDIETIRLMKKHEPDFLFLDVHISGGNGLKTAQLLQQLRLETNVILIGNEPLYALEAFRLRAFYYLLVPFGQDDLLILLSMMQAEKRKRSEKLTQKLPIESHEGISYILPHDILYINKNKENKTVSIHTKTEEYISIYTLNQLEEKLASYDFLRVHKSYLINLFHVKELKPYYNGTYNLYLGDYMNEPIPVSRNYVKRLRNRVEI